MHNVQLSERLSQYFEDYGLTSQETSQILSLVQSGDISLQELLHEIEEADLCDAMLNAGSSTYSLGQLTDLQIASFRNEKGDEWRKNAGLTTHSTKPDISVADVLRRIATQAHQENFHLSIPQAFLQYTKLEKYISVTEADDLLYGRAIPGTRLIAYLSPVLSSVSQVKWFALKCDQERTHKKAIDPFIPEAAMPLSLHPAILSFKLQLYPYLVQLSAQSLSDVIPYTVKTIQAWSILSSPQYPSADIMPAIACAAGQMQRANTWTQKATETRILRNLSLHDYKKLATLENPVQVALETTTDIAKLLKLWSYTLCQSQNEFVTKASLSHHTTNPSSRNRYSLSFKNQGLLNRTIQMLTPSSELNMQLTDKAIGQFQIVAAVTRDPKLPKNAHEITSLPWHQQAECWRNLIGLEKTEMGARVLACLGKKDDTSPEDNYARWLNGYKEMRSSAEKDSPLIPIPKFLDAFIGVIQNHAARLDATAYRFGGKEAVALRIASAQRLNPGLPQSAKDIGSLQWDQQMESWRCLIGLNRGDFARHVLEHLGKPHEVKRKEGPTKKYSLWLKGHLEARATKDMNAPIPLAVHHFLDAVIAVVRTHTEPFQACASYQFDTKAQDSLRESGLQAYQNFKLRYIANYPTTRRKPHNHLLQLQ